MQPSTRIRETPNFPIVAVITRRKKIGGASDLIGIQKPQHESVKNLRRCTCIFSINSHHFSDLPFHSSLGMEIFLRCSSGDGCDIQPLSFASLSSFSASPGIYTLQGGFLLGDSSLSLLPPLTYLASQPFLINHLMASFSAVISGVVVASTEAILLQIISAGCFPDGIRMSESSFLKFDVGTVLVDLFPGNRKGCTCHTALAYLSQIHLGSGGTPSRSGDWSRFRMIRDCRNVCSLYRLRACTSQS